MAAHLHIYTIDPFAWRPTETFIRIFRAIVGGRAATQYATPESLLQSLDAAIDPNTEHGQWHTSIKDTLIADATAWVAARAARAAATAAAAALAAGAPAPAPAPAPALTMTDLANFYIEKLMQRFEQQRIPALEIQLKSAVQNTDELPSSYWSRLERLHVQVPNVCTKDQLFTTFVNGLHNPTVKSYVQNVLHPLPR